MKCDICRHSRLSLLEHRSLFAYSFAKKRKKEKKLLLVPVSTDYFPSITSAFMYSILFRWDLYLSKIIVSHWSRCFRIYLFVPFLSGISTIFFSSFLSQLLLHNLVCHSSPSFFSRSILFYCLWLYPFFLLKLNFIWQICSFFRSFLLF